MASPTMTEKIQLSLQALEKQHSIKILFACESGSRAWGFPSMDSDFDVRFTYTHTTDRYLSIHPPADQIHLPIDDLLDINGWDLKKFLYHLFKSNSVLIEWLQSPVIYAEQHDFRLHCLELAKTYYSATKARHHYLGLIKKFTADVHWNQPISLKKAFYILRSTLAATWTSRYDTIPPMEIDHLRQLLPNHLNAEINELIPLKNISTEHSTSILSPELSLYIQKQFEHLNSIVQLPAMANENVQPLNDFFLKMIHLHDH
jgi:hypothetical protein